MGKNSKKSSQKRNGTYIKKENKHYEVNPKSTYETFSKWIDECGNDLTEYENRLGFCYSDEHKITHEKVGYARFEYPEQVEEFLLNNGYYTCRDYNTPTIHYIDWIKNI